MVALGVAGYFGYRARTAEIQRLADQRAHEEQLKSERRQRAQDDAIAAAMGGDLQRICKCS